jgi:hypothetical protein
LLFVVAAAILGAREVRRIFEMDAIIQSPGVQDLIQQLEAEGEAKGRLEHAREMLLRLLRVRFGEIPGSTIEQMQGAELAELDRWAERVLTAATVEEIFAEPWR